MSDILFLAGTTSGMRTRSSVELFKEAIEKRAPRYSTEILDLQELDMQFFDGRAVEEYNEDTKSAIDAIVAASLIVVAAPVYQGSIPGSLKNLFDLLPRNALAKKKAAIISLLGSNRYYLSPGLHLRPVLEELSATVLHPWISVEEKLLDVLGNTRDADLLVRMDLYAARVVDFLETAATP